MELAITLTAIVAVAAAGAAVAERLRLSEPLFLIALGVVGSLLPFASDIELEPEVVLVGLLPPLLFATAIRASLLDLKAEWPSILLLSVGLVVATAFVVGAVAWWLLPVPFAAAVALGAVVAPPDAVAASAIARRVGMPRRVVTVLEGESLLNDATALVALNSAIAALTGSITGARVGWDFLVASVGGAAIGLAVAVVLGYVRRHITDAVLDTTVSIVAPFAAYVPAEEVHASGVVAVVVCGLVLGQKAYVWQRASSRVAERLNWRTISFVLESSVFLLIGLQTRTIVGDAWDSDVSTARIITTCLAVLGTVIVIRIIWVLPLSSFLQRMRNESAEDRRGAVVVAWAGMRGVVTLAAAFVLPEDTPARDVLVLAALVVVAGTQAVQGPTLPRLMRRLRLRGPSRAEDALQVAALAQQAGAAGLAELDLAAGDAPADIVDQARARVRRRSDALWERLGPNERDLATPSDHYRRLRTAMLQAERDAVLRLRAEGSYDHRVAEQVLTMLDLEESMIDRVAEDEEEMEEALSAPRGAVGCDHLEASPETAVPDTPGVCQECIDAGLVWVHLRMCLSCGHVACCDSSVGNHATGHFRATDHPVMRSVEPGESWRWCFRDEVLG